MHLVYQRHNWHSLTYLFADQSCNCNFTQCACLMRLKVHVAFFYLLHGEGCSQWNKIGRLCRLSCVTNTIMPVHQKSVIWILAHWHEHLWRLLAQNIEDALGSYQEVDWRLGGWVDSSLYFTYIGVVGNSLSSSPAWDDPCFAPSERVCWVSPTYHSSLCWESTW